LWWDDQSLLKLEAVKFSSKKIIYVGIGQEGNVMEQTAKELYNKVRNMKLDNIISYFDYFESQDHEDVLHISVYSAFQQIYSK
jgi:predicted alpha/beta superfamily hydrolase